MRLQAACILRMRSNIATTPYRTAPEFVPVLRKMPAGGECPPYQPGVPRRARSHTAEIGMQRIDATATPHTSYGLAELRVIPRVLLWSLADDRAKSALHQFQWG